MTVMWHVTFLLIQGTRAGAPGRGSMQGAAAGVGLASSVAWWVGQGAGLSLEHVLGNPL